MEKSEYIDNARTVYMPDANIKPLPQSTRFQLGKILFEAKKAGLVVNDIAGPLGINRRTAFDMLKYYMKNASEGSPPTETGQTDRRLNDKNKKTDRRTDGQTAKRQDVQRRKLTVYVSEANYKALKHISIDCELELSELINKAIELLKVKYK